MRNTIFKPEFHPLGFHPVNKNINQIDIYLMQRESKLFIFMQITFCLNFYENLPLDQP